MGKPLISVVITAFKRRKFLLRAAYSALHQTLARELYEVIVVKNFEDDRIDRELNRLGVTNVRSNSIGLGAKVSEALEIARGDVVSLLEDDDEFMPGKLEAVLKAFSSRPRLGLYRNSLLIVDESGRIAGRSAVREPIEADCSARDPLRHMTLQGLLFNVSSMTVRRDVLDGDGVLRTLDLTVDSYCPLRALMSGYRVLMDPRPLTAYRIHGAQAYGDVGSFESFRRSGAEIALRHLRDARSILQAAEGSPCEYLARYLYVFHATGCMKVAGGLRIGRELRGSLDVSPRDLIAYFNVELLRPEPFRLAKLALDMGSFALPGVIVGSLQRVPYALHLKNLSGRRARSA